MTIEPKKNRLVLDERGIHYRESTYDFPFRLGKLRDFRGFKDVTLQLTREGKVYYLLIYDSYKGLVAKARVNRLDAVSIVRGMIHRVGFSDEYPISKDDFDKYFANMKYTYIGD